MQIRTLKIAIALTLSVVLLFFLSRYRGQIQNNLPLRDVIEYQASATLLVHRANPYDEQAVFAFERDHGYRQDRPLVLYTPPWSLPLILPLAFFSPFWGWVLWLALLLLCLIMGLRLCRRLYGRSDIPLNAFTIIAYVFAPVPACVAAGQMGLLLMMGIVLFLYFEREHPFVAGAALLLPFAKPHLALFFWLALILRVISKRRYQLAFGFGVSLAVAVVIPIALDPNIFVHYEHMLRNQRIGNEFIPALSGMLRLLFFRRFFSAQFVPMVLGLIWSIWYLRVNWKMWDWQKHGPALLVVSVLTTPYAWITDETILLPAILQGLAFVYAAQNVLRLGSKLALAGFGLLNLLLLLILNARVPFSTGIYFWSSLVWFGWYFYARRLHRKALQSSPMAAPVV